MSADTIFRFFQSYYGQVEGVVPHSVRGNPFAIIAFCQHKTARKASEQQQLTIAGVTVNVLNVDEFQQQCNLISLNDDCILEILKSSTLDDLCRMANVCTRLKALAQRDFASKYKGKVVKLAGSDVTIAQSLRNFGSLIHSICLIPKGYFYKPINPFILHLLLKYCGSLTSSEMRRYDFLPKDRSNFTEQLVPLFSQLHEIKLRNCVIPGNLFEICNVPELSLKDVTIIGCPSGGSHFGRLKKFKLSSSKCSEADISSTLSFISQPNNVEHIEIEAPYLQYPLPFDEMVKFENMKTLSAFSRDFSIGKAIIMIDTLNHLSQLILGWLDIFTVTNLLNIVRSGRNLQQLTLLLLDWDGANDVSQDDANKFKKMLKIVSNRPGGKSLNVVIVGNADQIKPFVIALPEKARLKINCLQWKTIESVLKVSIRSITISNEQLQGLRDNGINI